MKKSELSNFLELTNVGTIILPIGEHKFELSQQAAENMVVALRGALRLLTKRAADGAIVAPHCVHGYNGTCPECGAMQTPPRR